MMKFPCARPPRYRTAEPCEPGRRSTSPCSCRACSVPGGAGSNDSNAACALVEGLDLRALDRLPGARRMHGGDNPGRLGRGARLPGVRLRGSSCRCRRAERSVCRDHFPPCRCRRTCHRRRCPHPPASTGQSPRSPPSSIARRPLAGPARGCAPTPCTCVPTSPTSSCSTPRISAFSSEEARALAETVNEALRPGGPVIDAAHPHRWYVTLEAPARMTTTAALARGGREDLRGDAARAGWATLAPVDERDPDGPARMSGQRRARTPRGGADQQRLALGRREPAAGGRSAGCGRDARVPGKGRGAAGDSRGTGAGGGQESAAGARSTGACRAGCSPQEGKDSVSGRRGAGIVGSRGPAAGFRSIGAVRAGMERRCTGARTCLPRRHRVRHAAGRRGRVAGAGPRGRARI